MHTLVYTKYIESEGYWFNVIKMSEKKFLIFNTQRRRRQHIRDGIGHYLPEIELETAEQAKKYLNSLASNSGQ